MSESKDKLSQGGPKQELGQQVLIFSTINLISPNTKLGASLTQPRGHFWAEGEEEKREAGTSNIVCVTECGGRKESRNPSTGDNWQCLGLY